MIKSHVESYARYAGLIAVSIEWLALVAYYFHMPSYFGGEYPISYFAALPETRLAFGVCYTLAAINFWIFIKYYLNKYYRTPVKIFSVSLILFAGMALFPFDPYDTASFVIHSVLAYSSGILFIAGIYLMAKRAGDRYLLKVSVAAIGMSTALTIAFTITPRDSRLLFAFEAGSWLMLQLWVIWISFYIHRRKIKKEK